MRLVPVQTLTCPHDGAQLSGRGNTLVCANGHSFDRARESYVNLLPVQDKASRDPGDSKKMVAARRRFLEAGAYTPIAAALSGAAIEFITARDTPRSFTILDAGCGEGYYLQALAAPLAAHPSAATLHLAGIDISKWAVRAAAKRALPVTWAVASNRRPPLLPASTDLILCLFGFPIWPGFASIQPAGGQVILCDPGPDHLIELRAIIYPEVRRTELQAAAPVEGYTPVGEQRVQAAAHLGSAAIIADLLSMTPHAHRTSSAGRLALASRKSLEITIDVTFRSYARDTA